MASNQINSKNQAKWDQLSIRTLLDICTDEIRKIGKPGIGFRKRIWEEIRETFNQRMNKNYTKKQLKNKMDSLRSDWMAWKQLVGKEASLGWNSQTGTINGDAAWWNAKIKENNKYAKFRYHGLEFHDDLDFIFGGTVTTSQDALTPCLNIPNDSSGKNTASNMPYEVIESDDEDYNFDEENSHPSKKRKMSQENGKTEVEIVTSIKKALDRLIDIVESHNEAEKQLNSAISDGLGQYNIRDCIKILKSLKNEGLLVGRKFSYALEWIKDKQNRVILLELKESNDVLVDWILYKFRG